MRNMIYKTLVATSLALPLAANAADYSLGDVTSTPAWDVNSTSGTFTDYLFFDTTTLSTLSATLGSVLVDAKPTPFLDMLTMSVSLWADGGSPGVDGGDTIVSGFGGSGLYISDSDTVAAGSYYLKVGGTTSGFIGGAYTYVVAAVPVPEAETWAMMAAGLGLVGMQLRRRTRGKSVIN